MFVDASVIIAIMTRDPKWEPFADVLENTSERELTTSVLAVWEAAVGICRKKAMPMNDAYARVREFLSIARIGIVSVTIEEMEVALQAFDLYGRHRYPDADRNSALNLADCFHYATAKSAHISILTKDAGFALTDIETMGPEI